MREEVRLTHNDERHRVPRGAESSGQDANLRKEHVVLDLANAASHHAEPPADVQHAELRHLRGYAQMSESAARVKRNASRRAEQPARVVSQR